MVDAEIFAQLFMHPEVINETWTSLFLFSWLEYQLWSSVMACCCWHLLFRHYSWNEGQKSDLNLFGLERIWSVKKSKGNCKKRLEIKKKQRFKIAVGRGGSILFFSDSSKCDKKTFGQLNKSLSGITAPAFYWRQWVLWPLHCRQYIALNLYLLLRIIIFWFCQSQ